MATICAGISATWGGASLGEVTEINVERGGDLPLGRASTWTLDAGTIQIKCLSTANLSVSEYGLKKTFAVTGGGLTFSTRAVCQTLRMTGKVNDVARYEASFKVHAS